MTDGNSSLPPNPPPVSAWTTRAASSSRPRPRLSARVEVVRALQRAGDGDAAALGRDGDHRVVLDVELLLVADPVLALEDHVRRGEGGLDVARSRCGSSRTCGSSAPGRRRARASSCADRTALARRAQGRAVGRREQRQRLGVVLDLATERHEDRLVGLDRADDVLARDVGRGDDHDLRPVEAPGRGRGPSNVACASVERTVAPYQAPGTTMSSV